jgi:threonylcarbamoyladenosine tRNA methylthiotransferase MtaB
MNFQISEEKTQHFYADQIGKTTKVLWESKKNGEMMSGFTENYVKIFAPYRIELVNTVQEVAIGQEMYL